MTQKRAIPFELREPDKQTCPLFFNSPHSGRHYPNSFLQMSQLNSHDIRKSEDSYLDELFSFVTDLGASLMHALFPRAYLDLNREAFELDADMFIDKLPDYVNTDSHRATMGLGSIARIISEDMDIYREKITFNEALTRINTLYFPYHECLTQKLNDITQSFGYVLLIDCHSMPSAPLAESSKFSGKADIVLGNNYNKSCNRNISDLFEYVLAKRGYNVERNYPYAGGYITQKYGRSDSSQQAIQIEFNRNLYMNEDSLEIHDGFYQLQNDLQSSMRDVIKNLPELLSDQPIAAE